MSICLVRRWRPQRVELRLDDLFRIAPVKSRKFRVRHDGDDSLSEPSFRHLLGFPWNLNGGGDVGPPAAGGMNEAGLLQRSVGPSNRVEVDTEVGGELPDRRQFGSRLEFPPGQSRPEPSNDLVGEGLVRVGANREHITIVSYNDTIDQLEDQANTDRLPVRGWVYLGYLYFFRMYFQDSATSSLSTSRSTSSSLLMYMQPAPSLCFPSFDIRRSYRGKLRAR